MAHTLALLLASGNGWHHGHCWIFLPILLLLLAIVAAFFLGTVRLTV